MKKLVLTSEVYGDIVIVKIAGDFFLGNLQQVEDMWNRYVAENPRIIAFDCSGIDFLDSSAIGTLVKFLNNSERCNVSLVFLDISESILRIFKTAKLNRIFTINTREEFESAQNIKL